MKKSPQKNTKNTPKKAPAVPKKKAAQKGSTPVGMTMTDGFKKQYLKSGGECRVTFRLPKDAAPEAHTVSLVGDFNNWDNGATPMKKLKAGDFTVTVKLDAGHDYRFRYLIDGERWENDWHADRYEPNAFYCDDSIVVV